MIFIVNNQRLELIIKYLDSISIIKNIKIHLFYRVIKLKWYFYNLFIYKNTRVIVFVIKLTIFLYMRMLKFIYLGKLLKFIIRKIVRVLMSLGLVF